MKIKVQELCRPNGRSYLTIRADGRYLGTLWVGPEERKVIASILEDAADAYPEAESPFEWETVEK